MPVSGLPANLELWKSTDDGATWRRIELNDRRPANLFFTEKAVVVETAGPNTDSSGLELSVLDKKGALLRVMRLHPRE